MTIKDIAKLAGVSTATVSYVLNDRKEHVSDEVRKRVLAIIEEYDFIPNKVAKGLREKSSGTIGVLVEDIAHFNSSNIVAGINRYVMNTDLHVVLEDLSFVKRYGENLYIPTTQFKKEVAASVNILLRAQVEGIIYVGWQDRDVDDLLPNLNIPLVYSYCYSEKDLRSSISYNNETSMKEIMTRVLRLGHKKIALIIGDRDSRPVVARFAVFKEELKAANIPLRNEYIKQGDWSFNAGRKAYRELVALPDPPTAIVSLNDHMAAGVIYESMSTDQRVLDEISVVGYNGLEYTGFLYPMLDTMQIPLEDIGYTSAEQLVIEMHNADFPKIQKLLNCKYIKGNSLRQNSKL